MSAFTAILRKELIDNLRDRRSIIFALLYGPLIMPLLILGPIAVGISKNKVDPAQAIEITISGAEHAPNLVQFLRERNIDAKPLKTGEDFQEKIKQKSLNLVVELPENYEANLRSGKTLNLTLYYNEDDDDSKKAFRSTRKVLSQYGDQLTELRLLARGVDSNFLRAVNINERNLSPHERGEPLISLLLPFVIFFSFTMGGFYLAVDSTAGERERQSLEPLLTLSVSRSVLVLAKLGALIVFVFTSGLLAVLGSYIMLHLLPLNELTRLMDTSLLTFAKIFLVSLPLVVLFSGAMMLIASYAQNTKEAQTHLGFAMMLPMIPFFVLQMVNPGDPSELAWIPIMGQYLLIEIIVAGEPLNLKLLGSAILSPLVFGLVCIFAVIKMYQRESILK